MRMPKRTKLFMRLLIWGIWSSIYLLLANLIYLEFNVDGVLYQEGGGLLFAAGAVWLIGSFILWWID